MSVDDDLQFLRLVVERKRVFEFGREVSFLVVGRDDDRHRGRPLLTADRLGRDFAEERKQQRIAHIGISHGRHTQPENYFHCVIKAHTLKK